MASRSIRGRRIVVDSSSDYGSSDSEDDLPDLRNISNYKVKMKPGPAKSIDTPVAPPEKLLPNGNIVRRRKLGTVADNPLLRPFGDGNSSTPMKKTETAAKKSMTPQRIELRTKNTKLTSLELDDFSETESIHEETILEDFSGSDFAVSQSSDEEEEDDDDDDESTSKDLVRRPPPKSAGLPNKYRERRRSPSPSTQLLAEAIQAEERDNSLGLGSDRDQRSKSTGSEKGPFKIGTGKRSAKKDLTDPSSELRIPQLKPPRSNSPGKEIHRPATPPSPDTKPKGLASPSKKISRIPATPHHPNTDTFWNQEFIDEWNDEHSPKKELFPLPAVKRPSSPVKKGQPSQAAILKAAKKQFEQEKHDLADAFLVELDRRITNKELSELSAGTGGIHIEWTNRLLTTAGRANWKRETIKSKAGATVSTRYRHHASIELSTKVIDDETRLLNVIAHEFCHLANFMVSKVTTNPHGKEFKAWAAKVTAAFGSRGISVTTKHSYDIDFKYVWECSECGIEYKRHSKSINPDRHRCGACKSVLTQIKPVPRQASAQAGKERKESEYQKFMKEQMRLIKLDNPGSQQKDIMKIVGSRWAQREKKAGSSKAGEGDSTLSLSQASVSGGREKKKVEGVTKTMGELTVVDLT